MVSPVRIVGLLVVLEAVDPEVVVQVYPVQELGAVHVVAQEGLVVVGDRVADEAVVVLVEVRDEVVVFVPAGKDRGIAGLPVLAHRVRELVLVVVVLHQLDYVDALVLVIDEAVALGDVGAGRVARVHAVELSPGEPRVAVAGDVDHPGLGSAVAADSGGGAVALPHHARVLAVVVAEVVLAVDVETGDLLQLQGGAPDLGGRGQPVLEGDDPQVGVVLDVALRLGHQERHVALRLVELVVGGHPHLVVVAQDIAELDTDDLLLRAAGVVDETGAVEVVAQTDLLGAVGGQVAVALEAALDDRREADLLAPVDAAVVEGDDDVRTGGEEGCAAAVLGGVVAQDHLDEGQGLVLVDGELAADGVAGEAVDEGVGLVRVDGCQSQGGEVAHLHRAAAADEGGEVGHQRLLVVRAAAAGAAEAGVEDRALVLVGGIVELHAVPLGLGEGHGRQGRADLGAHGQGIVVLPLGVARDQDAVEPAAEVGALEHRRAELLGLGLGVVEDQPALGDEVAVEIVVEVALAGDADVPLVVVAGVVRVIPLPPAVLVEQLLGDVPPADGRVEGAVEHTRTLGLEGDLAAALDVSHACAVVLGGGGRCRRQEAEGAEGGQVDQGLPWGHGSLLIWLQEAWAFNRRRPGCAPRICPSLCCRCRGAA